MNADTSKYGNVGVQVVLGIVSVGAIVLAIAAIQSASSAKKATDDLKKKLDNEVAISSQLETEVRQIRSQSQNQFSTIALDLQALKDQVEKMAKKPEPPPKKETGGHAKQGGGEPGGVVAGDGSYTIKAGDTIGKIARDFGTNADAILKLNPGVTPTRLKIGQKIRVK